MLVAFWFEVTQGLGYGVTAESRADAERLLEDYGYPPHGIRITAVTENVPISNMDQRHVIPNSGPIVVRGIWFPRHNG